ncbi:iron ABC transporter permease [Pradoshia sp. D12]|uniref:FecCD family ABC transporter permease n=1 Tax=Bacillaceae TaxID=186817 RepID=UPI00080AF006|nr:MULTISPECIES: iron ABC transporter permease [Bacillaceae]OCA81151.1 ferrichrome ABC transporter permease [Bacillus sp. FJAT-27986]QFK73083.1 iron ABC transporter permease [Pradoshia sp. D12]TPF72075.1 iron ABC transporter permease [Bacillus sp. D12]
MQKNEDRNIPSRRERIGIVLPLSFLLLLVIFITSLIIGTKMIDLSTVWEALLHRNPDNVTHQIIWEIRLPRALMAGLVGAYLAISGAVMQALTRNPLAEPSLLGVSNGAAFALVLSLTVFSGLSIMGSISASMIGAGLAVLLVFSLSALSRGGVTPVKLALAGMATGMFLSSLTTSMALYFDVTKNISFWYAGELANSHWVEVKIITAVGLIGLPILLSIAHSLTLLSLGTDVTKGLGVNIKLVRALGIIVILLLTGSSVAVSGTIGFIGLVIPHITRMLIGTDYRKLLPLAAVLGSALLLLADVASRVINPPYETPVGVMTALIGVPFFLYLVRSEGRQLF